MARCIAIEGFDTDADNLNFRDMVTRINRGKKLDLTNRATSFKEMHSAASAASADASAGASADASGVTNMYKASLQDLMVLRDRLGGYVIRRTLFSKDNEGKPLSGMEMFAEIALLVRPYPHEAVILENTARHLSTAAPGSKAWGFKVSGELVPRVCAVVRAAWGDTDGGQRVCWWPQRLVQPVSPGAAQIVHSAFFTDFECAVRPVPPEATQPADSAFTGAAPRPAQNSVHLRMLISRCL